MFKKTLVALLAILMVVAMFAGCAKADVDEPVVDEPAVDEPAGEGGEEAAFTPAAEIEVPAGKVSLSMPVDQVAEKELKIATCMVQNNPFGAAVLVGQNWAKEILADRNCVVDCISVEDFDAQKWSNAIQNLIDAQYDAICYFGIGEALIPVTQAGLDAGIKMITFNTDAATADTEPGEGLALGFYNQNGFEGGKQCGTALMEAMGGKGEYIIITGDFAVLGHELRRTGARSILDANPDMILKGEFENDDKSETAYSVMSDAIVANPNLAGVYVTAGGPSGAAKAIEDAGKVGEIKMVCHDVLAEIAPYVASGTVSACLDQDPFNQGCQPVIDAFNNIVAGVEIPKVTFYEGTMAHPEDVESLFPELF